MTGSALRRHLGALVLVGPLALFVALFFLWPLATVMTQAVADSTVGQALPATSGAAPDWDRQSPPPEELKAALVEDLRNLDNRQLFGDIVRRLNSVQPGFRTLMGRTMTAISRADGPVDLSSVDRRWDDPVYWRAIVGVLAPYTDRHLLAALDLERDGAGAIVPIPAGESANRTILLRTFWVAAVVTVACAVIGLPYAMLVASVGGWLRQILLAAILLPLWTSLLVRTAAWYILLQDRGLINDALRSVGLIDAPLPLLFNRAGVVIAMTHVLLPLMVLPIYSVLVAIPKNLMPAAASLGAPPLRAFLRILLPLSFRGLLSGSLLVFMTAIGYYITPALIGGPQDQMISSIIAFYATGSANWGMAAALGVLLLAATMVLYIVYGWLSTDRTARA